MEASSLTPAFTTVRLTPIILQSSLAGGSRSPTFSSPESILFSISCTNASLTEGTFILSSAMLRLPLSVFYMIAPKVNTGKRPGYSVTLNYELLRSLPFSRPGSRYFSYFPVSYP
jgi:hypothetical protein